MPRIATCTFAHQRGTVEVGTVLADDDPIAVRFARHFAEHQPPTVADPTSTPDPED